MARYTYIEVELTDEEVEERRQRLAEVLLEQAKAEKDKDTRLEKFRRQKADFLREWNASDKQRREDIVRLTMTIDAKKEKRRKTSAEQTEIPGTGKRPGRRLREDSPKLDFPPKDEGGEAA